MKLKYTLLLALVALIVSSCGKRNGSFSSEESSSGLTSQSSSSSSSKNNSSSSSKSSSSSSSSGPKKVTVPAHTLRDNNPPIDVNSTGEIIDKNTWDSFRNAPASKFNGNYNYTYRAYSGGVETIEAFTKNGYYVKSSAGKLYYERKSGSTFYIYISKSDGYLRQETTLDLQDKYTYRIQQEIYVHMFDFENYEYNEYDGCYTYRTTSFGASVRFQDGYLTYMFYSLGMVFFEIKATFETTIDIPTSYYYE